MIPLSDGIAARRLPIVNVALIAANFAVFLFYELPNPDAVGQAAFYPCDVNSTCHMGGLPWGLGWITAMFMHAGWGHILGNMLFLAIFGKNVEDAFGRLGYLFLYFCGGFVAAMMQTGMTLLFGTASDAQIPTLGASGAIGRARRVFRALSQVTCPHGRLVVPGQNPGVALPRRLVSLPILRGQQITGSSHRQRRQRCRVLRPRRRFRLRYVAARVLVAIGPRTLNHGVAVQRG